MYCQCLLPVGGSLFHFYGDIYLIQSFPIPKQGKSLPIFIFYALGRVLCLFSCKFSSYIFIPN